MAANIKFSAKPARPFPFSSSKNRRFRYVSELRRRAKDKIRGFAPADHSNPNFLPGYTFRTWNTAWKTDAFGLNFMSVHFPTDLKTEENRLEIFPNPSADLLFGMKTPETSAGDNEASIQSGDDFVLVDAEDHLADEELIIPESEMASDDEIRNAEIELEAHSEDVTAATSEEPTIDPEPEAQI